LGGGRCKPASCTSSSTPAVVDQARAWGRVRAERRAAAAEHVGPVTPIFPTIRPEQAVPEAEGLAIIDGKTGVMNVVKAGRGVPRQEGMKIDARVVEQRDVILVKQAGNHADHVNGQNEQRK